jgi:hypothetical protein
MELLFAQVAELGKRVPQDALQCEEGLHILEAKHGRRVEWPSATHAVPEFNRVPCGQADVVTLDCRHSVDQRVAWWVRAFEFRRTHFHAAGTGCTRMPN